MYEQGKHDADRWYAQRCPHVMYPADYSPSDKCKAYVLSDNEPGEVHAVWVPCP